MNPIFKNLPWSLDLPPPWRIEALDDCLEITQPEGTGVMRISSVQRKEGLFSDADTLEKLRQHCPGGTPCEKVRCGDFFGHVANFVDWTTSRAWRVWFIACGRDLLHVVYACWRGEEELEAEDAAALLQSLRART